MKLLRERRIALIISAAGALVTIVPYLIATLIAPAETTFTGFLINPIDGFTYLAKMRQGASGYWSLILPYAPEPGPRTFIFVYYLLLGHVSRILDMELIWVFHLARFLGAVSLFYLAYLLNEELSTHRHVQWFGFGLIILGSGLGWLSLFFSRIETSDILIPESIPFMLAYSNAHFPIAAAALLGGILTAIMEGWRLWTRAIVAAICGTILGALLPFTFLSLAAVLAAGSLLEAWEALQSGPRRGSVKGSLNLAVSLVASSLGALPWLAYDLWLSSTHPVISSWNAQNRTPSPHPSAYLLGFAPWLILAFYGYFRGKPGQTAQGRLIMVWLLSGSLLLYAPFAFQRRLSLGLAIPLSILAAWGWGSIPVSTNRRKPLAILILVFMMMTNFLVVFAGLTGVAAGEPAVIYQPGELESYKWLNLHVKPGSMILAGEQTGNRLPAFADVRVLYGHPFETPDSKAQAELVKRLYQDESAQAVEIRDLGIKWVYLGPDEKALGEPAWLEQMALRWEQGEITLYEVPEG